MTAPPPAPVFDAGFRETLAALFEWRRDVRRFRTDPLPPGALERLLALADGAPSVGLSQPWRFVTVDDSARRDAIRVEFARCNAAALATQDSARAGLYARLKLEGLTTAPVQLAVCVDPAPEQGHGLGRATQPETAAYSAVLAVHTLWLAARAAEIGVGWVSILDPPAVLAVLEVPASWRLVAYLCVGFAEQPSAVPELEAAGWERRGRTGVLQR